MGTRLYTASLQAHLAAFRRQLNQQEINDQYQLMQMSIVRESERQGLSQVQTIYRLEQLKEELKAKAAAPEGAITPIVTEITPTAINPPPIVREITAQPVNSIDPAAFNALVDNIGELTKSIKNSQIAAPRSTARGRPPPIITSDSPTSEASFRTAGTPPAIVDDDEEKAPPPSPPSAEVQADLDKAKRLAEVATAKKKAAIINYGTIKKQTSDLIAKIVTTVSERIPKPTGRPADDMIIPLEIERVGRLKADLEERFNAIDNSKDRNGVANRMKALYDEIIAEQSSLISPRQAAAPLDADLSPSSKRQLQYIEFIKESLKGKVTSKEKKAVTEAKALEEVLLHFRTYKENPILPDGTIIPYKDAEAEMEKEGNKDLRYKWYRAYITDLGKRLDDEEAAEEAAKKAASGKGLMKPRKKSK